MSVNFKKLPSHMDEKSFMARFEEIYEHSPWVPARVWAKGIISSHDEIAILHQAMITVLASAERCEKLALIRAHPDLAGKAAIQGDLTHASTNEQAGAGLDTLTSDEHAHFTKLNDAYKAKFNFPFIKAVKKSNKHEIIKAFETRLQNSIEVEFETALNEINKIALFRLSEL